jgi:hypothetical protein
MRLDWAMLADAATARENLGFIIAGGIDTLYALPAMPGQPPLPPGQVGLPATAAIIFRLLLARAELGRQHAFELRISDEDGKEIMKLDGGFFAPLNPQLAAGWDQPLVISFNMMIPPQRFGTYGLDLFGNGVHLKTIPFRILQHPMPPQIPPGMPSPGLPGGPPLP